MSLEEEIEKNVLLIIQYAATAFVPEPPPAFVPLAESRLFDLEPQFEKPAKAGF